MIYKCSKCSFVFERTQEPSKCPNCESQNIIEIDSAGGHGFIQQIKPSR